MPIREGEGGYFKGVFPDDEQGKGNDPVIFTASAEMGLQRPGAAEASYAESNPDVKDEGLDVEGYKLKRVKPPEATEESQEETVNSGPTGPEDLDT
jgi:hypothetical protein